MSPFRLPVTVIDRQSMIGVGTLGQAGGLPHG
jgi:hypothetical protein